MKPVSFSFGPSDGTCAECRSGVAFAMWSLIKSNHFRKAMGRSGAKYPQASILLSKIGGVLYSVIGFTSV
jgi:hypothetical protein